MPPWSATLAAPAAPVSVPVVVVVVTKPVSVMTTEAVLAPDVEYVFETDALLPDKLSVPLQEYAYGPLPPVVVTVQVTGEPGAAVEGDGAHEAVSAGALT